MVQILLRDISNCGKLTASAREGAGMGDSSDESWRRALRKRLQSLPIDFVEAAKTASAIRECFHEELASVLGPRLNECLRNLPQDTHREKQGVASFCNSSVHGIGLRVKCPRTNRPALLVVDIRSGQDDTSRFRIEVRDDKGRKMRTYTSTELPELELMGDPPRRESLSRWTGDGNGGRSRG
jgi:hypothetical protein